jgi:hypothetical protein
MPRPYVFWAGGLTFFRGCAIIRSLRSQGSRGIIGIKGTRSQGSRGIKGIITKGFSTIIRDNNTIRLPYNTNVIR